jgi:hypothetical protein
MALLGADVPVCATKRDVVRIASSTKKGFVSTVFGAESLINLINKNFEEICQDIKLLLLSD